MTINFNKLAAGYPTIGKDELFDQLGGQWPSLKRDSRYNNTCALRLSVALIKSGIAIDGHYKEAIDGNGRALIIKVKTMDSFLRVVIGQQYWGISKPPGVPITGADIPSKKGIIVYHAAWADATGHFDLWNGSAFIGAGNFNDIKDGFDIALWNLP